MGGVGEDAQTGGLFQNKGAKMREHIRTSTCEWDIINCFTRIRCHTECGIVLHGLTSTDTLRYQVMS